MKKTETPDKYKDYRNLLSTIIKKYKKKYYNEFFKNNMNNTKNNSKGIRNLINWKQSVSSSIHFLSQGNQTVTNLKKTVKMTTTVQ